MSVSYIASLKSTRMQAIISAIDGNIAGPGVMEIGVASMTAVLVAIILSTPSFTESGGVITMANSPKIGTASAAGIAASARIKDGGGNIIVSNLTVGISNADIILSSVNILSGETVTMTSATITHSP
jgi:hypothetical protein